MSTEHDVPFAQLDVRVSLLHNRLNTNMLCIYTAFQTQDFAGRIFEAHPAARKLDIGQCQFLSIPQVHKRD